MLNVLLSVNELRSRTAFSVPDCIKSKRVYRKTKFEILSVETDFWNILAKLLGSNYLLMFSSGRSLETIPSSLLFHCISSLVQEVKRPSQALCWPLGLIGCSSSLSVDLRALGTYCPRFCIVYNLGEGSDVKCVHCLLYHIHTAFTLAAVCVHIYTNELSGLCGLLTALQQP